jgi:lipoprotein-anchoring transpeptidase ErfK/SrfK
MAMRTLFFFLLLLGSLKAHDFPSTFYEVLKEQKCPPTKNVIIVNVHEQKLELYRLGSKIKAYTISTGKKGTGQTEGSCQTPLGLHRIAKKIGAGAPSYTIFQGRKNTGKIWRHQKKYAKQDLVLTRILWLEGLQEGFNKGMSADGCLVDSFDRYIYIHSTNHEESLGKPDSKGCVRMSAAGMIDLFNSVEEGDLVFVINL